ncbi:MAG TPA: M56 family metallopeptidase [Longimicrobium sp.]|nr:M56 family metallopeptidase [Longimicrobium sp.]
MSAGMMHVDTAAALSAAADLAVKGTVVLAAAWIATLALRRASASARHLAWAVGFGGLLALPVLAVALPSWQIPILPAEPLPAAPITAGTGPQWSIALGNALEAPDPAPSTAAPVPVQRPAAEPKRGIGFSGTPLGGMALLAWVTGAALALLRLGSSITRVRREERTARPMTEGPAAEMRDRLVWRLGIDRPVVLLEGGVDSMPLTWGVRRPRVLLPPGTEAWPADRLEAVLTHELAHVRRRDCAWQLVAEAACALHWFNPLAWAAAQRLRLESEHACDDQVLLTGRAGADYAGHLLDVARTLRPPRPAVLAAVPMARPSQLRTRMLAVLSAERARGPVSARLAVPALAGAGLLVAAIAALTPARAGAAEPFAVSPGACSRPGRGTFDEDVDRNGIRTVAWRTGSCSGNARIEGDVRFTEDFTAVRSISPGGVFRLTLRDGGRRTEVVIRPGAGGVRPTMRAGGRELPWGPDAERWLAVALPQLIRRTSYGADQRALTILARHGVDAALREMDQIPSPTVRNRYADALLGASPDAGAMRQALDQLATAEPAGTISPLLQRVAPRVPADAEVQSAYLRAAERIDSRAEQRRALVALAESGPMARGTWLELFRLAGRIDNGHDLELLLGGVAPRLPADGAVHEAYLEVAGRIRGSADRRRALAALVATRKLDAPMQVRVLGFVAALGNSTERELLLAQAAPHLSRDPRVAHAYRAAAEHVANADERRRALAAYEQPASPARDAVPRDRLDDPEATTVLTSQDRHEGATIKRVMLAKDVMLTADRAGIERISLDGWLVFREEAPDGSTRRVRIGPGPDGRLRHHWDGDFLGVATDAWLRQMIDRFARLTYPSRRW